MDYGLDYGLDYELKQFGLDWKVASVLALLFKAEKKKIVSNLFPDLSPNPNPIMYTEP